MLRNFVIYFISLVLISKTSDATTSEVFFIEDFQFITEEVYFEQAPPLFGLKAKILEKVEKRGKIEKQENKKAVSMILAVFLGHFGAHRLYLGTKTVVPIAYTLTLGGGFGLLPLADFIALAVNKDISKFENNESFFMWIKPQEMRQIEEDEQDK
jgi:TM2 domain-containing membrane protein YozV